MCRALRSFSAVVETNEGGVISLEDEKSLQKCGCFSDDKVFWAEGMSKGTEMGNGTQSLEELQVVQ